MNVRGRNEDARAQHRREMAASLGVEKREREEKIEMCVRVLWLPSSLPSTRHRACMRLVAYWATQALVTVGVEVAGPRACVRAGCWLASCKHGCLPRASAAVLHAMLHGCTHSSPPIDGAGWGWHTRCRRLIKREMIRRATELFTLKLDTAPKAAAMETDEMKVRGRWVCVWRGRDDA